MKEIETVKAVIKGEGEDSFLLLRIRNSETWQFVTGGIEENESPKEAMLREIREEIDVSKDQIISINKMSFRDIFTEDNFRIKSTIFLVEVEDVKIDIYNNPDEIEHEDFEWLSKSEVLERLEFKNQKEFFEKIICYLE